MPQWRLLPCLPPLVEAQNSPFGGCSRPYCRSFRQQFSHFRHISLFRFLLCNSVSLRLWESLCTNTGPEPCTAFNAIQNVGVLSEFELQQAFAELPESAQLYVVGFHRRAAAYTNRIAYECLLPYRTRWAAVGVTKLVSQPGHIQIELSGSARRGTAEDSGIGGVEL